MGNNNLLGALGYGSILLQVPIRQTLLILDVLYVPSLAKNLLSVTQITNIGNTVITFTQMQCIINTKSPNLTPSMKFRIKKEGNLFHWV